MNGLGDVPAIRTRIDAALNTFADARRGDAVAGSAPLLDAAVEFVAGGKRLRPYFCLAGWQIAGGALPVPEAAVTVAASLEWLQGSALVHDDLIDQSDTRRGRPSVHRAFGEIGTATAVLLGDLMLTWCDQMVRSADWSTLPSTADAALGVLDTCKNEVVTGQFLDVLAQTRDEFGVDEAMQVITYKTSKYTVERPLHLGAVMAGADPGLLDALTEVALPLGAAFQLRDDVLGVFGDPEITGKPAGDDLREGKRTVLVARAMELADDARRGLLRASLGTADGITAARQVIVDSGALAAVENDIASQSRLAATAIAKLGPDAASILRPLLDRATARRR